MRLTFNFISGLRDKITQANLCFGSVALVAPMSHTIKFVVSTLTINGVLFNQYTISSSSKRNKRDNGQEEEIVQGDCIS
jgi:hypothetical protein